MAAPKYPAEKKLSKIAAIQLLRGLAAAIVVIAHQAFAFADHVGEGLGLSGDYQQASQTGVAVFFVISGYIMVTSSRHLFGQSWGRREFWTRRLIRIMPPYWLATLAMVLVFLVFSMSVPWGNLAKSAVLFPFWPDNDALRAVPFLWPGWTLFYELVFYALFGLGIASGRLRAVGIATLAIIALCLAGYWVEPVSAFLFTITRPILLLFIGGMALALFREQGRGLPVWLRIAAGAGASIGYYYLPSVNPDAGFGLAYAAWCGVPALLLCAALMGGALRLPLGALIIRFGDISYALYLLHLPMAWLWMRTYHRALGSGDPWGFLFTLLIATLLVSIAAFYWFERPMTRWLNRRFFAHGRGDDLLQQTGI